VKRYIFFAIVLISSICSNPASAAQTDTPYFNDALKQAQTANKDIVVFLYGSDWCRAGQILKEKVWTRPEFIRQLESHFIQVEIDRPEHQPKGVDVEALKKNNSKFNVGTSNYPAFFLFDSKGRLYGRFDGVSAGSSSREISKRILELQEKRKQRDTLWAQAEKATGTQKAELLGQGLDLMGMGLGHKDVYKPIFEDIKKADSQDASAYIRKYGFNLKAIENQAKKLVGENKQEAAIAYLDKEIRHPGNRRLSTAQVQQIHFCKFNIYRGWKGHENERFDVLREIAKVDLDTNLGIGSSGYYLYHKGPVTLRYGWQKRHCQTTQTTWTLGDEMEPLGRYFPKAGDYEIVLGYGRGKNKLKIDSVTLIADGRQVAADAHSAECSKDNRTARYQLKVPYLSSARKLELRVVCKAEGGNDSSGSITVTELTPPNAPRPNRAQVPLRSKDSVRPVDTYLAKQDIDGLKKDLEKWLKAKDKAVGSADVTAQLQKAAKDAGYVTTLMQYEILRECDAAELKKVVAESANRDFLNHLFNDAEWMQMLMCSGPFVDRAKPRPAHRVLEALSALWNEDPDFSGQKLYKMLATAIAIETANPKTAIWLYQYYVESHKLGKLHATFDTLQTWEMRFVVKPTRGEDGSLRYLRDTYNMPISGYNRSCWSCPYKKFSIFGDSIQGPYYYMPWRGMMPHWKGADINGGVCGTLSTFGTTNAKAHGIPAMAMGEPGHCSYTVRQKRGKWQPCYSLSGKRSPKHHFYRGSWQHLLQTEKTYADTDAARQAYIHRWQAHLYKQDNQSQQVQVAYELAVKANPLHYGIWRDYLSFLSNSGTVDNKQWFDVTKQLLVALKDYPEPAWDLIKTVDRKAVVKGMNSTGILAYYELYHRAVSNGSPGQSWRDWNFHGILDHQVKTIGGDKTAMQMFRTLLGVYAASDYYRPAVLEWGKNYVTKRPKLLDVYCSELSRFVSEQIRKGGNEKLLRQVCSEGIQAASKAGDVVAFRKMTALAEKQLNLKNPKERYLSGQQLKNYPKIEKMPGACVSSRGLLKISSVSKSDTPLQYAGVLDETGGFFHTGNEKNPWAVVQLPSECKLTGIVIVNRFESNQKRQIPLKVLISEDEKTWTEVFTTNKVQGSWTIPLNGDTRARFIKVEASHEKPEPFHLRNILVYGKPA